MIAIVRVYIHTYIYTLCTIAETLRCMQILNKVWYSNLAIESFPKSIPIELGLSIRGKVLHSLGGMLYNVR